MSLLGEEAVRQAGSQLGVTEATGHNDGVAVEKYLKSVGLGKGYAWCMAFVYWCFKEAAKKLGLENPLLQTGGVQVCWESKKGTRTTVPSIGAQFFIIHANGTGHTGICGSELKEDGTFNTIEGNSNNNGSREGTTVVRHQRKLSEVVGFKVYN